MQNTFRSIFFFFFDMSIEEGEGEFELASDLRFMKRDPQLIELFLGDRKIDLWLI
jgi:hypothetical protein